MATFRSFSVLGATGLVLLGLATAAPAWAGQPWFRGGRPVHGPTLAGSRGYGPGFGVGFHRVGYLRPRLPHGYLSLSFGGAPWYYGSGLWYRPWGARFMVAAPPFGLCVPELPLGYLGLTFGGVPYYCYNDVYYIDHVGGGFEVAAPPRGVEPVPTPSLPGTVDLQALGALTVFPKKGQSEAAMKADRQEAQAYATGQTGYDPSHSDPQDPGTPRARAAYLRTFKAFLEGRGYSVQ